MSIKTETIFKIMYHKGNPGSSYTNCDNNTDPNYIHLINNEAFKTNKEENCQECRATIKFDYSKVIRYNMFKNYIKK